MKRIISVLLTISLLAGMLAVGASAESFDANDITVEMKPYMYYRDNTYSQLRPVVKANGKTLQEGTHYTLSFNGNGQVSPAAQVTVKGIGDYTGYEKTFTYALLKKDVSTINDVGISVYQGREDTIFIGAPCTPEATLQTGSNAVHEGSNGPCVFAYEDNVNVGDAVIRAYGTGNYCGMFKDTFEIKLEDTEIPLQGVFNGVATGELNDQVYYSEYIVTPGKITAKIDTVSQHLAYYALYRVEGEEATLLTEKETEFGNKNATAFTYDFTDVYDKKNDLGGEVYMLAYSWMDGQYQVFSGVMALLIPTKVAQGTSVTVEQLPDVGSFRTQYLTYYSEDGDLELPQWSTSDPSVATVEDGTVTFKKPGTVTVTAKCGTLSDSISLTAPVQDLTKGALFAYTAAEGKAYVYYDGYLLEEGVDYTTEARTDGETTQVTVTGINLFQGKLMAEFDENGHAHSYDAACDATCNSCDYVRDVTHTFTATWMKDTTYHWHSCTLCGEQEDKAEHTFTAEAPETCTVCGPLNIPGDLDGNFVVNEDDAIYLLQHVLMPEIFTVEQNVDYDNNGIVNEDDAIYLLQHILMPDMFPL